MNQGPFPVSEISHQVDAELLEFERWCEVTKSADLETFCKNRTLTDSVAIELKKLVEQGNRLQQLIMEESLNHSKGNPFDMSGQQLGNYQIKSQIGTGGMGSVWLADQIAPVQRQVAIKLIRPGMNSSQLIQRFESERQMLALMSHPNIANVLDAGGEQGEQLYLVMEYVNGVPIVDYCNQNQLDLNERLTLLLQLCDAIQHAHQKGVIHRDLKPSNILVSNENGTCQVKVIDFGLAKVFAGQFRLAECLTTPHVALGSPLWMSPEQAKTREQDDHSRSVDTRSDIYSIGVILYQLITNTTPIEKSFIEKASPAELFQAIEEPSFPRPSIRLKHVNEHQAWLEKEASSNMVAWSNKLRSELDWVTMKALEKDPDRRYPTVTAFADDVNRFINHEPLKARPPSTAYRIRKAVDRNRVLASSALAITITLLVATIFSTALAVWAIGENEIANRERKRANSEKNIAQQEKITADLQRVRAESTTKFIINSFSQMNVSRTEVHYEKYKEEYLLSQPEAISKFDFSADPLTEADLRSALADALSGFGKHQTAIQELGHVLGLLSPMQGQEHRTIETKIRQANEYLKLRNAERAEKIAKECIESNLRLEDSSEELELGAQLVACRCQIQVGNINLAIQQLEKIIPRTTESLGHDHEYRLIAMETMANALNQKFLFQQAAELLDQCRQIAKKKLGKNHKQTVEYNVRYFKNSVRVFRLSNQVQENFERYMDGASKKFSPNSPFVIRLRNTHSEILIQQNRVADALKVIQDNLASCKSSLGERHTITALTQIEYAKQLIRSEPKKAIALVKNSAEIIKENLGENSRQYVECQLVLGEILFSSRRYRSALAAVDLNIPRLESRLGRDCPPLFGLLDIKARCLISLKQHSKADQVFADNLRRMANSNGEDSIQAGQAIWRIGTARVLQGRFKEAIPHFRTAYAIMNSHYGTHHVDTHALITELYNALLHLEHFAEAKSYIDNALKGTKNLAPDATFTLECQLLGWIGDGEALLGLGRVEEAINITQRILQLHYIERAPTQLARTESTLAACLIKNGEINEAERYLKSSLDHFDASTIRPEYRWCRALTLERLIELYESRDDYESAEKYREMLQLHHAMN